MRKESPVSPRVVLPMLWIPFHWIFYRGDEKNEEGDEGMKHSRCEREKTKEEKKGKREEKRLKRALEPWRLKRRWNFGSEEGEERGSGEMRSK